MSTISTVYSSSVSMEQVQYKKDVSNVASQESAIGVSSSVPQDSVEISKEAQDKIKADAKEKTTQSTSSSQSVGAAPASSTSATDTSISELEKQIAALEKEIAALQKKSDDKYSAQLLAAKQAQLVTLQAQLLTLEMQSTSA